MFCGAAVMPTLAHIAADNSIVQRLSSAQELAEQGRTLYEAERFNDAAEVLQRAAADFKAQGNVLRQAMTLCNLSLVYQQLGQWSDAEKVIVQSLYLLNTGQNLGTSTERSRIFAQALDIQGYLQLALSQSEAALNSWQQAGDIYTQIGDEAGIIRSRINSASALQALGLYRQAKKTLTESVQRLETQPNSLLLATGLRHLGNVLRIIGDLGESRKVLEKSLEVATTLQSPTARAEILLALGNTTRARLAIGNTAQTRTDTQVALKFYQQAAATSTSSTIQVQAQLYQLSLLLEDKQWNAAVALLPQILARISNLPPSRTAVYARIDFAQSLLQLRQNFTTNTPSELDIAQLLSTAAEASKSLADQRATSYALGTFGELYEQTQQKSEAIDLTQQALLVAQAIDASDIAYQWQWQLGRLLKTQGDIKGAIAAYDEAIKTLQSLRYDLVAINPDVQFSFRESVEPIYRQFVDLLLRTEGNSEPSQNNLQKARKVIESLQLAELNNFFREACLVAKEDIDKVVDQKAATAAVIYPIILPDRLEIILKLANQDLRHYTTAVPQSEVESTIEQLGEDIREFKTGADNQSRFQKVYAWLLQPVQTVLRNSNVETLVFVLDGSLRNIPMAALYDGKQYLVENYSVAVSPGLQLFDLKSLEPGQLKALIAGLSEARHNFPKLDYVESELKQIQSEVPSLVLLNPEFTNQAFQTQINSQSFPIVHLATHGQFSSNPDETFILAYDQPIKVNQLNKLLRSRDENRPDVIELLVLSACQTATGDKQAALGLAGVAVRAGARSTLASLWNLNDASTALLMSHFYQELAKPGVSKAQALRLAQQALLKQEEYEAPYFWAPYILVGNWL